jgi:hypothetical protein
MSSPHPVWGSLNAAIGGVVRSQAAAAPSNTLSRELAIAHAANAAHNKFAADHVNAAAARLIATIIEHGTPAFSPANPQPDEYDNAAETLRAVLRAVDDWAYAIAIDAADNARTSIEPRDYLSAASEALSGLIADLQQEADDLREVELEDVT